MSETGGLFPFDDLEEFPEIFDGESEEGYVYRDFEIDWKTMKMTGRIIEGKEAVWQWAYMALRTRRYDWIIYSWYFGEEYTELIGYSYSKDYLYNEVNRTITECLMQNPYISGINNLTVTVDKEHLRIEFVIISDFGDIQMSV